MDEYIDYACAEDFDFDKLGKVGTHYRVDPTGTTSIEGCEENPYGIAHSESEQVLHHLEANANAAKQVRGLKGIRPAGHPALKGTSKEENPEMDIDFGNEGAFISQFLLFEKGDCEGITPTRDNPTPQGQTPAGDPFKGTAYEKACPIDCDLTSLTRFLFI